MRLKPIDLEKLGITDMPELKAEQWGKMYVSEKVAVFQECERRISEYEKREALNVFAVDMNELALTYPRLKGSDSGFITFEDGYEIALHEHFLSTATSYEAFEKYAHEAAHAYQMHSMNNPGFHPSHDEVAEWKEAREEYPKEGLLNMAGKRYSENALEVDARCFAEPCSRELKQTHDNQRAQGELAKELLEQNSQQITQDSSPEPEINHDTEDREH